MTIPPLSELLNEDRIVLSDEDNAITEESIHVRLPHLRQELIANIRSLILEHAKLELEAMPRPIGDIDPSMYAARAQAQAERLAFGACRSASAVFVHGSFITLLVPDFREEDVDGHDPEGVCWATWHVHAGRAYIAGVQDHDEGITAAIASEAAMADLKTKDKQMPTLPQGYIHLEKEAVQAFYRA